MKQTPIGRILCRLGSHLLAWKVAENGSIIGGCLRCGESFQWDC